LPCSRAMALLSATSPAKAHLPTLLAYHDEPQQHQHALPPAHPQCFGGGGGKARQRARSRCAAAMRPLDAAVNPDPTPSAGEAPRKRPRVLVAGGGIGGLVLALAARRKGYDVTVFERDLSAVRGEGQYRGPIQIQSNALAALEAIDMSVAEEVMRVGCVTGDRINGLVDGMSGSWYAPYPFLSCNYVSDHLLVYACCACARVFASVAAPSGEVRTATSAAPWKRGDNKFGPHQIRTSL
jgi:zeaxanthin epoxidase